MQPELRYSSPTAQTGLAVARNKVLRNTYMMLGLTMIPTVIGAMIGMSTNFAFLAQAPIMGPLVMFAVMMGLLFGVSATRNSVMGIVLLFAFTFVAGWWLGRYYNMRFTSRTAAKSSRPLLLEPARYFLPWQGSLP